HDISLPFSDDWLRRMARGFERDLKGSIDQRSSLHVEIQQDPWQLEIPLVLAHANQQAAVLPQHLDILALRKRHLHRHPIPMALLEEPNWFAHQKRRSRVLFAKQFLAEIPEAIYTDYLVALQLSFENGRLAKAFFNRFDIGFVFLLPLAIVIARYFRRIDFVKYDGVGVHSKQIEVEESPARFVDDHLLRIHHETQRRDARRFQHPFDLLAVLEQCKPDRIEFIFGDRVTPD